jgi:hypothetical protein
MPWINAVADTRLIGDPICVPSAAVTGMCRPRTSNPEKKLVAKFRWAVLGYTGACVSHGAADTGEFRGAVALCVLGVYECLDAAKWKCSWRIKIPGVNNAFAINIAGSSFPSTWSEFSGQMKIN